MKNEQALCAELALLQKHFPLVRQFWRVEAAALDGLACVFAPRREAERDFTRKQLIPYALVLDKAGRALTYRRQGSEGRLAGLFSAGIGGHVNERDAGDTLSARLLSGLAREMQEELGISLNLAPRPASPAPPRPAGFDQNGQVRLLGMINEDESEVGLCHIGVVFRVDWDASRNPSFSDEIAEPEWRFPADLDLSRFELWSALALRLAGEFLSR